MHPLTTRTVLLADDDASIVTVLTRAMQQQGYTVKSTDSISDIDAWIAQGLGDVVVTDVTMPRGNGLDGLSRWMQKRPDLKVIVMSAHNMLLNAARSQELGAVTFLPKPFDLATLMDALKRSTNPAPQPASAPSDEGLVRIADDLVLVGQSPAMQRVFRSLANLIGNDLTVLITGESGTGKDCIARALHALGPRKAMPFVALNMAAIPRELIESTLFGHEKGAFTGALNAKQGAFAQAHGGTLFLDEIGDMPMEAQTRLLRVLQEQQVTPVGGAQATRVDVRIIAATHRDLAQLVREGRFREDLYFRLHVVPLALPTLNERREDIPQLAQHFLAHAKKHGLKAHRLSADALALLAARNWPGNVRELEHTIYRLCAMAAGTQVEAADMAQLAEPRAQVLAMKPTPAPSAEQAQAGLEPLIDAQLRQYFALLGSTLPATGLYDQLLAQFERPLILHTLRATHGNQIKAAEVLGINRNTLRKKMRLLGIDGKLDWKQAA